MLLIAGLSVLVGPIGLDGQLAGLGLAVVLFGPPRLARDRATGSGWREAFAGRSWPPVAGALLLGLAGLVLVAWLVTPTLILLALVGLVALQTGRDAAEAQGRRGDPLVATTFGALPFVLPAAFHPHGVGTTLAWSTLDPDPHAWIDALGRIGPLLAIAWCTLAGLTVGRLLRRSRALAPIGVLVAGGVLCAFAPPLIAFTGYMATTSGVRGVLGLAVDLAPTDGRAALAATVQRVAPLVGAALTLAAFGLVVALFSGLAPGPALAIVPVWGFGAIALPHLILEALGPARVPKDEDAVRAASPLGRIRAAFGHGRRRGGRDRRMTES